MIKPSIDTALLLLMSRLYVIENTTQDEEKIREHKQAIEELKAIKL